MLDLLIKLGLSQTIYKASLIFSWNVVPTKSIILKHSNDAMLLHLRFELRCLKIWEVCQWLNVRVHVWKGVGWFHRCNWYYSQHKQINKQHATHFLCFGRIASYKGKLKMKNRCVVIRHACTGFLNTVIVNIPFDNSLLSKSEKKMFF